MSELLAFVKGDEFVVFSHDLVTSFANSILFCRKKSHASCKVLIVLGRSVNSKYKIYPSCVVESRLA